MKTTKEVLMKRNARRVHADKMWTPELENRVREELLEVCPSLERMPLLMQNLLHSAKESMDLDMNIPYRYLREYLELAELELKLQKMGR